MPELTAWGYILYAIVGTLLIFNTKRAMELGYTRWVHIFFLLYALVIIRLIATGITSIIEHVG